MAERPQFRSNPTEKRSPMRRDSPDASFCFQGGAAFKYLIPAKSR
jgi:hypothetical protein